MAETIELELPEKVRCCGCEKIFFPGDGFFYASKLGLFFCSGDCFCRKTNYRYLKFEQTPTGKIKIHKGEKILVADTERLDREDIDIYIGRIPEG